MATHTRWDLRYLGDLTAIARQAGQDADAEVRAHWVNERTTRSGRFIPAHWDNTMRSDLTEWAAELTDDFMQQSIAIPADLRDALRVANLSRDAYLIAEAQKAINEYITMEKAARNLYEHECLKALKRAYFYFVDSYNRVPVRTTPLPRTTHSPRITRPDLQHTEPVPSYPSWPDEGNGQQKRRVR